MARAQSALATGAGCWRSSGSRRSRATSRRRPTSRPGPRRRRDDGRLRGRVEADGRACCTTGCAPPRGDALAGVEPRRRARGRRGRAAAGARLLRRQPRLRPEHRARSGLFYLGAALAAAELVEPSARSLSAPAAAGAAARCARSRRRSRRSRASARRLPAAGLDRPPPRLHRARAPRSRRRASSTRPASLRRPAALPAGGSALRSGAAGRAARRRPRTRSRRACASSTPSSPRRASTTASGGSSWRRAQELAGPGSRPGPRPPPRRSPTTCCRATSRPSSPRARAAAGRRAARRRSRSSAGRTPETSPTRQVCWHRASSREQRRPLRGRELRRLGAREALRRHPLPGDLRGRRAGRDAEGLRLLRQGRRRRTRGATRRSRAPRATSASAPTSRA